MSLVKTLCRYKLQFLGVLIVFISLPFVVIGSALTVTPKFNEYPNEEQMRRQYFDRQYSVNCFEGRDTVNNAQGSYSCEIRPENISELGSQNQTSFCKSQPNKCRPTRPKIDCTKFPDKCESITTSEGDTAITITKPKSGEEEKYYLEQQNTEEKSQNIFDWLGALFGSLGSAGGGVVGTPRNLIAIPNTLANYKEAGINDSGTPNGNPLGGGGLNWISVGCVYLCSGYGYNSGNHLGFDMSPTANYISNSKAYNLTNQYIVMATCSGSARSTYEPFGGNYVIIKCKDSGYYVIYMHLSAQFMPSQGKDIIAGQPIGVMGGTGINTTGPHLHYQIGTCEQYVISCTINPIGFLN